MLKPVVLAGGVGSRLWPVSRALLPKQFIQFPSRSQTLFQGTLSRLEGVENVLDPIVVCNEDHRFLVAEQLRQLGKPKASILLEPQGRNTAPAVAMAAMLALETGEDPVLLVLPADHLIKDQAALLEALGHGAQIAQADRLVTFGIVPDTPETGFGYIEKGERLDQGEAFEVARFVEKPDLENAAKYVASNRFLWNSGMFMFKASVYLAELRKYAPDIFDSCVAAFASIDEAGDFSLISAELFSQCRSDSIDYAVMEKTANSAVVPLDADWSDLGSWEAVWASQAKDDSDNAVSGDVLLSDVSNSYVHSESRLVAAVGISNAVIIETADSVLVANKNNLQNVKEIVKRLETKRRSESAVHTLVPRPWGSYELLAQSEGYKVKHIIMASGASLSLQLHHHRSEHWTVIKGTGLITIDDKQFSLSENESTFIPIGAKHRLENPGAQVLELIEVQVGDHLSEDDIVRFDDVYGRADQKI